MDKHLTYINGTWMKGSRWLPVLNPATDEVFAEVATVNRETVSKALDTASAALDDWRGLTPIERSDYLLAIARELYEHFDDIARVITLENGKPLAQSKGEVAMSIDHLRWFGEEARRAYGRVVSPQVRQKRQRKRK